ncbi:MAG: hypothetical protein AAF597_01015 [Bacteroidota bacterium]
MFKHVITLLLICFTCSSLSAQPTVESDITGLQFNLLSILVYHERGLSDEIALRLEAGATTGFRYRNLNGNTSLNLWLQPFVLAEPRYYYNFAQREAKGKRTSNNSGNFVGLKTEYRLPRFLASTFGDGRRPAGQFSFIPRWGIRRDLGSGWDFELGLGAGWQFERRIFADGPRLSGERTLDISWRFGFRF